MLLVCISLPHVQYGQTPFLLAAGRGHVEVAGFLLDNVSSILERTDVSDHQFFGHFLQMNSAMQFAMGTIS